MGAGPSYDDYEERADYENSRRWAAEAARTAADAQSRLENKKAADDLAYLGKFFFYLCGLSILVVVLVFFLYGSWSVGNWIWMKSAILKEQLLHKDKELQQEKAFREKEQLIKEKQLQQEADLKDKELQLKAKELEDRLRMDRMKLELQAATESSKYRLEVGRMYMDFVRETGGPLDVQALQSVIADTTHAMLMADSRTEQRHLHWAGLVNNGKEYARSDCSFNVVESKSSSSTPPDEPQGQQKCDLQAAGPAIASAAVSAAPSGEKGEGTRRKSHHQRTRISNWKKQVQIPTPESTSLV